MYMCFSEQFISLYIYCIILSSLSTIDHTKWTCRGSVCAATPSLSPPTTPATPPKPPTGSHETLLRALQQGTKDSESLPNALAALWSHIRFLAFTHRTRDAARCCASLLALVAGISPKAVDEMLTLSSASGLLPLTAVYAPLVPETFSKSPFRAQALAAQRMLARILSPFSPAAAYVWASFALAHYLPLHVINEVCEAITQCGLVAALSKAQQHVYALFNKAINGAINGARDGGRGGGGGGGGGGRGGGDENSQSKQQQEGESDAGDERAQGQGPNWRTATSGEPRAKAEALQRLLYGLCVEAGMLARGLDRATLVLLAAACATWPARVLEEEACLPPRLLLAAADALADVGSQGLAAEALVLATKAVLECEGKEVCGAVDKEGDKEGPGEQRGERGNAAESRQARHTDHREYWGIRTPPEAARASRSRMLDLPCAACMFVQAALLAVQEGDAVRCQRVHDLAPKVLREHWQPEPRLPPCPSHPLLEIASSACASVIRRDFAWADQARAPTEDWARVVQGLRERLYCA